MSYFTFAHRCLVRFGLLFLLSMPSAYAMESGESAIWDALRSSEGVAMIRHALAPGGGDPANFDVNDCSTQRNLSDEGRTQAAAIGSLFEKAGMDTARLFSSQWCRCLETAKLMAIGDVTEQPLLNSFFRQRENGPAQISGLQEWLVEQTKESGKPIVMVTHQVNITGLTGVFPSSGEIVVIRLPETAGSDIEVIGTLETR